MKDLSMTSDDLYFISGGGEMGELIRTINWTKTSLGEPAYWPQSLCTMVSVMLNNPFAMYIAWGNNFTQLYNDAFRPILGEIKHPEALGISSRETFKEIWHIIGPMFDDVMLGKPVRFPDLMVPLNRNGFIEECYFDFAYSPVYKEDGVAGGVLVTVIEITNKKKAENALKDSEVYFKDLLNGLPLVIWTADSNGNLTYISNQWEEFYGNPLKESLGSGWANYVFPDDMAAAAAIWAHSIEKGQNYETEFRVKHKSGDYRWVLVRAIPIRNENGEVVFWNGSNTDIHDKKLSEQAARESEDRFRTMADNIPNLAWMANAEGKVYWYNKKWYEYIGTTPAEMEGWERRSVHDPKELPNVMLRWEDSISSGKPFEMTFPLKGANGQFRQFLTRVLPVVNNEGKIYQWFGTNTDITDQIHAEAALKESEERFRTMAEGTDILIATSDEISNATYFNKAYIEFTGRPIEALLDFGWTDLIHAEDRDGFISLYLAAFKVRKTWTGEFRMLNKEGEYRWLLAKGAARIMSNGSFAGYISSSVDITERKIAEKAVQEKEQNLRNTILQAPAAMCIFKGPEHVVELANERMMELWGKSAEKVLNKPLFEGLPEAKNQGFEALLDGVYKTGESFSAQGVAVTLARNGKLEKVYVNFAFEAYRENDGSISGIIAVAIDSTDQVIARQKIEEVVAERTRELENANNNLKKSNAELAQFAYVASHDLQEPLRKISTFSSMLEKRIEDKLDEQSRNYLNKINSSSTRMTLLIRDVLTYSELVKENEVFVEVDLNETLETIKSDYELLIEQKNAVIYAENLPKIKAIPLQMSQLFGNIIGNALKFSRKDIDPIIRITAIKLSNEELNNSSLNKDVHYCKLIFTDNGIGFKKEYAEKIFNIFQRLHGKSDYEGTGIGLALCKKITLNHGGDLDAAGSSENGAVFNVILPVKQSSQASDRLAY